MSVSEVVRLTVYGGDEILIPAISVNLMLRIVGETNAHLPASEKIMKVDLLPSGRVVYQRGGEG